MITVLFFAQFRERLGVESMLVNSDGIKTVADLITKLAVDISNWQNEIDPHLCLTAVNQTLVTPEEPLKDGDEVAFFPPVTGG